MVFEVLHRIFYPYLVVFYLSDTKQIAFFSKTDSMFSEFQLLCLTIVDGLFSHGCGYSKDDSSNRITLFLENLLSSEQRNH